jgi:hypothetical protein
LEPSLPSCHRHWEVEPTDVLKEYTSLATDYSTFRKYELDRFNELKVFVSVAESGGIEYLKRNRRSLLSAARCPLWVMCGRRVFGKNIWHVMQIWLGAVMCSAC